MKHTLFRTLLIFLGIIFTGYVIADKLPDNTTEQGYYFYYFHDESLSSVINKIAKNTNQTVKFDPSIFDIVNNTKINGKFQISNNQELLTKLAQDYRFEWFNQGHILNITSDERYTKSVELSADSVSVVRKSLIDSNILDSRFGFEPIQSQNRVIITGPRNYVDFVANKMKILKVSAASGQFTVFHLKYASASDIVLNSGGKDTTIPGVVSILNSLLSSSKDNEDTNINEKYPVLDTLPIKLQNSINKIKTHLNESNGFEANSHININSPIVVADQRSNTVLIRDKQANLNVYAKLIEALDIPTSMVQVSVAIITVDDEKLNQSGINWWGSNGDKIAGGFGVDKLSTVPTGLSTYFGGVSPGSAVISNTKNFISALNFLEGKKIAKTTNKPYLITQDNLPAIMSSVQTLYISSPVNGVTVNNGSSNGDSSVGVTQAPVTTSLSITPHVISFDTNKYEVNLSIILQDGSIINQTTAPTTNQNTVNSQAVIENGQSLILGGYSKVMHENEVSQVPFLGSIPLLGWFFKSSTITDKNETQMYLITPTVILPHNIAPLKQINLNHSSNLDN